MNKSLQYILIAGVLVALLMSVLSYVQTPKVGVVDFKRLVSEYQGMKDASNEYDAKMKEWNHMSDSISNEIKLALSDYYADSAFLSKQELNAREMQIINMRNKYVEFTQGLDANAEQEDQKMTAEVVNQVLSFVDKFGTKNGYDAILGRNEGNYVLYKSVEKDITDELLKELNLNYDGL